jgi:hypothetical protein
MANYVGFYSLNDPVKDGGGWQAPLEMAARNFNRFRQGILCLQAGVVDRSQKRSRAIY